MSLWHLIALGIVIVVALAAWTGVLIVLTISLLEERSAQRGRKVVAKSLQRAALEMARAEQPAYAALDEDYFAALPLDEGHYCPAPRMTSRPIAPALSADDERYLASVQEDLKLSDADKQALRQMRSQAFPDEGSQR